VKKIYRHPLDAIGTFTYHDWDGAGTVQHIADLGPNRYFFVDEGMPIPTSEVASFELVNLTDELAVQLREVTMPDVTTPIKSDNEVKQEKLQALNAERDAALDSGAKFGGNTFHSNAGFLTELLGLVLGFQAGVMTGKANIRTLDNKIVQLDAQGLAGLAKAVGDYRQSVYAKSWAAKDKIINL
jgi:hypothetical protein